MPGPLVRQVSNGGNITSSKLPFQPSIEDNEQQLVCRAENSLVADGTLEDRRTLNVHCESRVGHKLSTYGVSPGWGINSQRTV